MSVNRFSVPKVELTPDNFKVINLYPFPYLDAPANPPRDKKRSATNANPTNGMIVNKAEADNVQNGVTVPFKATTAAGKVLALVNVKLSAKNKSFH